MAKTYNFRFRFNCPPSNILDVEHRELELPNMDPTHHISLIAGEKDTTIKKAKSLVLNGSGWSKSEEARKFGAFYINTLARVFARLRIGADFGDRAPKSLFTNYGLKWIEGKTGRPTLNNVHGLIVYEPIENLQFATMNANGIRGVLAEKFLKAFEYTLRQPKTLTDRERVALELFNQSFFQQSVDSRFLLLMSGLEALIEQGARSPAVKNHIRSLISATSTANDITPEEKEALKSGLGMLKRESIIQAGKRLVKEKLDGKSYNNKIAEDFFLECYGIRSRLVHGGIPFPTREDVSAVVAQLEVMLSNLLEVGP